MPEPVYCAFGRQLFYMSFGSIVGGHLRVGRFCPKSSEQLENLL